MWGIRTSAALIAFAACAQATAQELVYEPVNPNFGGDSFNSSHLLAIANSQNDYDDPDRATSGSSETDLFLRQLQSRLLSSLAGEVNEAIFGENPQDSGTIVFGDQTIDFYRSLDAVVLTITDNATGSVTEIEVPMMLAGGSSSDAVASAIGGTLAQSGGVGSDQTSDSLLDLSGIPGIN